MKTRLLLCLLLLDLPGCTPGTFPVTGDSRRRNESATGPASAELVADAPAKAMPGVELNDAIRIMAIRLTPEYTILDVRFTNRGQGHYTTTGRHVFIRTIWIDPAARLLAANGTRQFAFIKATGIPVYPRRLNVDPVDQVSFSLYFKRLDKGLETFDWIECPATDAHWCWQLFNVHVDNPADTSFASQSVSTPATDGPVLAPLPAALPNPTRAGEKITLHNVYFETTKAELLPASFAELTQLATLMHHNPQMTIRIEGHTDALGDHRKNVLLSQNRAAACRQYLVQRGIAENRIQTVGYGDSRPLRTGGTAEARQTNRRVEFVVVSL